ncbi:Lrp/AsnC family transcriptional regulator [Arsenicicoccus sp. oral taxon 190]|uniref:Lrp/AsnC family transcriptional regulator n=1 Tax=Arsenicicoccus sp. oral taxon 190 TaxID=1658671 RepID=UPI00067A07BF|nr:Lrp/AsnC family transcriptional regulator [Arsenicicoccus sp. oral taxon 190]AKT51475.1 AsnC family transcriptional regulator [Arsenicicoccus sp. oral taxon 190]
MSIDDLDRRILRAFTTDPHVGVLGASRALGVARGTVQARLDRMQERGVIRSFAPQVDAAALGYPVIAFATLEIRQDHGHEHVVEHLLAIPEVLEAHTITGSGDIWIRLVGRDNADLQRVIDDVVAGGSVIRTTTVISLATRISHRTAPLVDAAARHHDGQPRPPRSATGGDTP